MCRYCEEGLTAAQEKRPVQRLIDRVKTPIDSATSGLMEELTGVVSLLSLSGQDICSHAEPRAAVQTKTFPAGRRL